MRERALNFAKFVIAWAVFLLFCTFVAAVIMTPIGHFREQYLNWVIFLIAGGIASFVFMAIIIHI